MAIDQKLLLPETPLDGSPASGTRFISRKINYGFFVLIALFVCVAVSVGVKRAEKETVPQEVSQKSASSTSQAQDVLRANSSGSGLVAGAPSVEQQAEQESDATADAASSGQVFITVASNANVPRATDRENNYDAARIQALKLQLFDQALQSGTGVDFPTIQRRADSGVPLSREDMLARIAATRQHMDSYNSDATLAYKARLEQLRASGLADSADAPPEFMAVNVNQASYASFDALGGDRWSLAGSGVTPPNSRFELRAGFVIPAVMLSGVNSDLPGQVIAQVSQNVFDSATGKFLLIPQGTRLVGSYASDVAYGQERVMMAWQRLIFPDGKALDLGAMPGADGAGYAGFSDTVDNHYFRTFTSAFLMSGIIAGVALSQPSGDGDGSDRQRAGDSLSEALGQSLGSAMSAMIQKNLNIAPTIQIRPGYRFNVMVVKDIPFARSYKSFDYEQNGGGL